MADIEAFLALLEKKRPRIGVVGDAMIDEYYEVSANRVSPEFPIPVLKMNYDSPSRSLPGGAANVCYQFLHFPIHAYLISEINPNARYVYDRAKINSNYCVSRSDASVPIKRRFYQSDFPLCRVDVENGDYGKYNNILTENWAYQPTESKFLDFLILSDYNKGILDTWTKRRFWLDQGIPTIVDPKHGSVNSWAGCTIFKPNSEEARRLSGYENIHDQLKFFRDEVRCRHTIITKAGDGISGWDGDAWEYFEINSNSRNQAVSVIGAGDCFVAILSICLSCGINIRESCSIAFEAGKLYVTRKHNEPLHPAELSSIQDTSSKKYAIPRERDFKLVFTNGCFDLLHPGHIHTLTEAKKLGDKLVVALNSDESIRRLKGDSRPILPLKERIKVVSSLEAVDYVCWFDEDNPEKIINEIKPDVIVKGGDYMPGDVVCGDCKEVVVIPFQDGYSTTEIIKKIKSTDEL